MKINLNSIYKIDVSFSNIYILDKKRKKLGKKILLNTSTRVFEGEKYDTLYIIEPKVTYLVPLPKKCQNNLMYIKRNLLGETGIILQILDDYILLYNTNENLIYLNKDICICEVNKEG